MRREEQKRLHRPAVSHTGLTFAEHTIALGAGTTGKYTGGRGCPDVNSGSRRLDCVKGSLALHLIT